MVRQKVLKMAFVTYEYPPDTGGGGIGTYIFNMAKLMEDYGFIVYVFCATNKASYIQKIGRIIVHRVNCNCVTSFNYAVTEEFSVVHNDIAFDILESPEIHGNAFLIKQRFPNLPLIVKIHGPNYMVESLKKYYVTTFEKCRYVLGALRRGRIDLGYWRSYQKEEDIDFQMVSVADFVTTPSNAMRLWVVDRWGLNINEVKVLSNPFLFNKSLLDIPINQDEKRVVFFGRLNVLKGLVNASKAIKKFLLYNSDWRFRIIGNDGPGPSVKYPSMREWMSVELDSVFGQIEFFDGYEIDELPALLNNSCIVLLPSLFESFSYTCLEAMASGKAVVGSNVGGMDDLLKCDNGLLINPNSVTDIYNALCELKVNKELRCRLASNARNTSMRWRNDKIVDSYLEMITML
jgi:glycogen(starch) synthase